MRKDDRKVLEKAAYEYVQAARTQAEFRKDDSGKIMMGCLPPRAMMAVGRVLTWGAWKYGRQNWSKVEGRERYFDAALRHLFAWWAGEDKDADTGESHLSHAVCCILFMLELEELGVLKDDRPDPAGKRAESSRAALEWDERATRQVIPLRNLGRGLIDAAPAFLGRKPARKRAR